MSATLVETAPASEIEAEEDRRSQLPRVIARPSVIGVAIVASFTQGLGVYWDIAHHIDIGRDTFFTTPHMFILTGMALFGLAIVFGLGHNHELEKHGYTLRPALIAAGLGVVVQFVSLAFIDNWWHAAYGIDTTLWSPPHLLAIFGGTIAQFGLIAGASAELRSRAMTRAGYVLLTLLVSGLCLSVMIVLAEYEFGIPQFRLVYQPIVLTGIAVALLALSKRILDYRFAATAVAGIFTLLRVLTWGELGAMGRTVPAVPLIIITALAIDLSSNLSESRPPWLAPVLGVIAGAITLASQMIIFPIEAKLWFLGWAGWTWPVVVSAAIPALVISALTFTGGWWLGGRVEASRPLPYQAKTEAKPRLATGS